MSAGNRIGVGEVVGAPVGGPIGEPIGSTGAVTPEPPRRAGGLKTVGADPVEGLGPLGDFPDSERVFVSDPAAPKIRVPFRRIQVGGG